MQIHDIQLTNNLQELTKHGTATFPMAIYRTQMSLNVVGHVQLHWHDEIQFILVLQGSVKIKVNRNSYIIEAGEGLFINSSHLHSAKSYQCDDSIYICFNINPSIIAPVESSLYLKYVHPVLDNTRLHSIPFRNNITWQIEINKKLMRIYNCYEDGSMGYELLIQSQLLSIWHKILDNHNECLGINEVDIEDQRIKQILTYIHGNYSSKISLDDLAGVINISRPECCRFFKRMIGQTPFQYINDYRMNQSIHLLKNTSLNITEIAGEVGLGSTSYFIERFKKYTNYTPREFRAKFI